MRIKMIKTEDFNDLKVGDRICVKILNNNYSINYSRWRIGDELYGTVLKKSRPIFNCNVLVLFEHYIERWDKYDIEKTEIKHKFTWWITLRELYIKCLDIYKVINIKTMHNLY